MDWQLPDIGKTITNNILPARTQYLLGDTVILSVGGSRLFPCISVSCRVIPMDTHWSVYSQKTARANIRALAERVDLYDCQMMRSRMKSRVLRASRVTL